MSENDSCSALERFATDCRPVNSFQVAECSGALRDSFAVNSPSFSSSLISSKETNRIGIKDEIAVALNIFDVAKEFAYRVLDDTFLFVEERGLGSQFTSRVRHCVTICLRVTTR